MKKLLILVAIFFYSNVVISQSVSIDYNQIISSMRVKADLYKLSLNNSQGPVRINLIAELKNNKGKLLYKFKIDQVTISNGRNYLYTFQNLVQDVYIDPGFAEFSQKTGFLPPGGFEYCVSLNVYRDPQETVSDCQGMNVITEVLLEPIYPRNNEVIDEVKPNLSWVLMGMPSTDVDFKIRLVDLKTKQNPNEALRRNAALIGTTVSNQSILNYPFNIEELIPGSTYVWQVQASFKGIEVATSEAVKFSISKDTTEEVFPKSISYLEIDKLPDSTYCYAIDVLKVYCTKDKIADTLFLNFSDKNGNEVEYLNQKIISLKDGENWLKIPFSDIKGIKHKDILFINISDQNNLKLRTLKVRYLKSEKL